MVTVRERLRFCSLLNKLERCSNKVWPQPAGTLLNQNNCGINISPWLPSISHYHPDRTDVSECFLLQLFFVHLSGVNYAALLPSCLPHSLSLVGCTSVVLAASDSLGCKLPCSVFARLEQPSDDLQATQTVLCVLQRLAYLILSRIVSKCLLDFVGLLSSNITLYWVMWIFWVQVLLEKRGWFKFVWHKSVPYKSSSSGRKNVKHTLPILELIY